MLSGLAESVTAGHHRLDPILAAIADAALHLTGASGAAIAMWKDGVMVCRARSGETAPALGAEVGTNSGISGECLRTGVVLYCRDTDNDSRVDPEVCRSLGLRSIVVAPIVGWHGINGILEIFSSQPNAFTDDHTELVKQLAGLAEKARALRPKSATPIGKDAETVPKHAPGTASDRLRDVVFAALGSRKRRVMAGLAGAVSLLLIGSAIWLGLHTPEVADAKVQATPPSSSGPKAAQPNQLDPLSQLRTSRETTPGEAAPSDKPSAGTPVQLASKSERIRESEDPDVRIVRFPVTDLSAATTGTDQPVSQNAGQSSEPPPEPPLIAFESHPAAVDRVLNSAVTEPKLAQPISQGVTGGDLLRRVSPRYPPQAMQMRLEGTVRVDAVISERGHVEDLKIVDGSPVLARAAADAIRQWRYRPYELNGKPVRMTTTITVNFKLPQ